VILEDLPTAGVYPRLILLVERGLEKRTLSEFPSLGFVLPITVSSGRPLGNLCTG